MAVAGQGPQTHGLGPVQSLRGDVVAPMPGALPLPVPYAVAGGTVTEIASGFQAIVSNVEAAAKEIKDTVANLSLQVDKMALFMESQRRPGAFGNGMQRDELVSAFQEAFLTTAATVVTGLNQQAGGGGGPGGPPNDPTPRHAPGLPYGQRSGGGPFQESPASRGQVPTTDQMRPPGVPEGRGSVGGVARYEHAQGMLGGFGQQEHGGPRIDPFGLRHGMQQQGFDVGGIRQRVAGSIQRGLSSMQFGPDLAQDDSGRFRWAAHTGRGGQFASADEIVSFQRAQKVQSVIGEIGESGFAKGIASAFPTAGAVLGGASAVAAAAWAGSELYANQREQNAAFQRVLGGSNLEGMRERGRQQVFAFQNRFGVMGSDQASELYAGVVGIDERANNGRFNRGEALNFGQRNYSRMGMTAEESIRLINMAAENGEVSLSGLAEALDRVTESARSAGVDADEAREKFTNYYQAAITGGAGRGASQQAGVIATMQASLGPGFQSANFGGLVNGNPITTMQQARAVGMDWTSYQNALSGPDGSRLRAQAETNMLRQLSQRMLGGAGTARVRAYAQEQFAGKQMSPEDVTGAQWEGLQQAAGINPFIAQQQIQAMMPGVQVSPEQAVRMLAGVQADIIDPADTQAAAERASAVHGTSKSMIAGAKDNTNDDYMKDVIGGWSTSHSVWTSARTKRRHEDRASYVHDWVGDKGVRSPIVEWLLKNHDDSRRFRVESADGPRVVDLNEAMSSYMDQLASGAAEIVDGAGEGYTVADAAGMEEDPNASKTLGVDSAKTQGKGKKEAKGERLADWEADHKKKDGDTVRVIIEPDEALSGFIRARVPGSANATVDSARAVGTPPPATTDPALRHQPGDG